MGVQRLVLIKGEDVIGLHGGEVTGIKVFTKEVADIVVAEGGFGQVVVTAGVKETIGRHGNLGEFGCFSCIDGDDATCRGLGAEASERYLDAEHHSRAPMDTANGEVPWAPLTGDRINNEARAIKQRRMYGGGERQAWIFVNARGELARHFWWCCFW
ncbi:unnamed protein product [Ilex paraguariensis]|uniref:Uncharacterized protein n=1 Tax=Ilex paraguariensis TaxID=185542 RepID=A0ABC8TG07_9AQUA